MLKLFVLFVTPYYAGFFILLAQIGIWVYLQQRIKRLGIKDKKLKLSLVLFAIWIFYLFARLASILASRVSAVTPEINLYSFNLPTNVFYTAQIVSIAALFTIAIIFLRSRKKYQKLRSILSNSAIAFLFTAAISQYFLLVYPEATNTLSSMGLLVIINITLMSKWLHQLYRNTPKGKKAFTTTLGSVVLGLLVIAIVWFVTLSHFNKTVVDEYIEKGENLVVSKLRYTAIKDRVELESFSEELAEITDLEIIIRDELPILPEIEKLAEFRAFYRYKTVPINEPQSFLIVGVTNSFPLEVIGTSMRILTIMVILLNSMFATISYFHLKQDDNDRK
ncbi:MAG TPA: hypothetical protein ENI23_17595 [bacterium]|nr:hypothetical protein [bacterium]